jgi:RNA polymerase sigma-70 factor (ECF subfamily)
LGRLQEYRPLAEGGTDDDLLVRIANGDQRAFRLLMERHGRPMLALAQRVTGSSDDADEIVQECFLKVWRLAERWKVDGAATFSTWFYRVVLNACLDRKRRAPMAPLEDAGEPVDPSPDGADEAQDRQRRDIILAAVNDLPDRQRQAVWLCYFGEVSGPQAAKILDMTLSALEALLVRGRRGLKKSLSKSGIESIGDIL